MDKQKYIIIGVCTFVVIILLVYVSIQSMQNICNPDEYFSNYECKKRTICPRGFYMKELGDFETDDICEPITVCQDGHWAHIPATLTSDSECTPHSTCATGQYVKDVGTKTSDTICQDCSGSSDHWISPNTDPTKGSDECKPHTVCGAGKWAFIPGTLSSDTQCKPHKTCTDDEFLVQAGNETTDTICQTKQICNDGSTYLKTQGTAFTDNECVPLQQCTEENGFDPNGQCDDYPIIDLKGNRTNDRKCRCKPPNENLGKRGFWRPNPNPNPGDECSTLPCQEHSACGNGQYLKEPGTEHKDNKCEFLSSCSNEYDRRLEDTDCNLESAPHVKKKNAFGDREEDNKCRCAHGQVQRSGDNPCMLISELSCECSPCFNDDNSPDFGWIYDHDKQQYGCGYLEGHTPVHDENTIKQEIEDSMVRTHMKQPEERCIRRQQTWRPDEPGILSHSYAYLFKDLYRNTDSTEFSHMKYNMVANACNIKNTCGNENTLQHLPYLN